MPFLIIFLKICPLTKEWFFEKPVSGKFHASCLPAFKARNAPALPVQRDVGLRVQLRGCVCVLW